LKERNALVRRLDDGLAIVEGLLQQVRQLSLELRPPLLDDLGLVPALRWHLDQQAQNGGLRIALTSAKGLWRKFQKRSMRGFGCPGEMASRAGPRLRVFSPPSDVTPGGQPASRFTWKTTDGSSAPPVLTVPGCVSILLNINEIIFNFFLLANLLRSEVFTAMTQNEHPHNLTPAE
jgi:hypothetical protein